MPIVGVPGIRRDAAIEDDDEAQIGDEGGEQALPRQFGAEKRPAQQHDEDRIGEEDEPLQLRGDVGQALEVEQ